MTEIMFFIQTTESWLKKRLLSLVCTVFHNSDVFVYLCLHHVRSTQSHLAHKRINVHCFLTLQLLKQDIQGDDGARPPDSGAEGDRHRYSVCDCGDDLRGKMSGGVFDRSVPAVNHSGRSGPFSLYVVSQQVSERDQHLCALWHSVVGPGSEVEVLHRALLQRLALRR